MQLTLSGTIPMISALKVDFETIISEPVNSNFISFKKGKKSSEIIACGGGG